MRRLRPGHVALCILLVGLVIGLALTGIAPWFVLVLLIGCLAMIGLAVWLMVADETTDRTERDRRDRR